jgi:hypothetical protein
MSTPSAIVESLMTSMTEHRWESAEALLADDFVFAGPVPQPIPKAAFLAVEKAIHGAMDDWDYALRVVEEHGGVVKTVIRITAKHARTLALPMPGFAPVHARGAAIALPEEPTTFVVKGGKVARIDVAEIPGGGVGGLLAQIAAG